MIEQEFDLTSCPLQGLKLIEASAGTGKTFAIVGIYLRLLMEKFIPVEKILVVTFTEAATAELKVRISDSIQHLLSALQTGITEEPLFQHFLDQHQDGSEEQRFSTMQRLQQALFSFDEASILTIHGFCHKMLSDFAFETNSTFDAKLLSNQEALIAELTQDYWRGQVYSKCQDYSRVFLEHFEKPDSLSKEYKKTISRPQLRLLPQIEKRPYVLFKHVLRLFQNLQSNWNCQKDFLSRWTSQNKIWRRDLHQKYFKQVQQYFENSDPFTSNDVLQKLTSTEIQKKFRGDNPLPPFFKQCDNFYRLKNSLRYSILVNYFQWAKTRLEEKKRLLNVYSFDDLLQDFHSALQGVRGPALVHQVRRRIAAALIDEFQDTDPLQYEIFSILFKQGNLFLIGDPKQAIYSFRGADVFAYLQAKKEVQEQFTLSINWRSDPRLVEAIGHFFSVVKHPFVHQAIPWFASRCAPQNEDRSFYVEKKPVIPMQIWYLQAENAMKVSEARQRIIDATVTEIIRLLNLGTIIRNPSPRHLNSRRGTPGPSIQGRGIPEATMQTNLQSQSLKLADIAVLVRTHREAEQMRDALSQKNIPSILKTQVSIFQTDEYQEILSITRAIAEFQNPALVKGALLTDIMGYSRSNVTRIVSEGSHPIDSTIPWEDKIWNRITSRMAGYHEQWNSKGFYPMMRMFLSKEQVHKNLLALPNGERRLTNVLHVIELLHQAESEGQRGIRSLLIWAHAMKQSTAESHEENLIRLETDADALKILTVHSCKGLEFPIVFCPFSWGNRTTNDIFFHDEMGHLVWDLEKKVLHQKKCREESLAEDMRLLYVALTRAKFSCYLAWGHINHSKPSPLNHLFGEGNAWDSLKKLESNSRGTVVVSQLPNRDCTTSHAENYLAMEHNQQELQFETFQRSLKQHWQVTSFSALSTRLRISSPWILETGQDHDQQGTSTTEVDESLLEEKSLKEESTALSLLHFPAGTKTGECFHELMEQLDFQEQAEKNILQKVEEILAKYQFEMHWKDIVFQMTRDVFQKKIPLFTISDESRREAVKRCPQSNSTNESFFTLADLYKHSIIKEMPFYFPIGSLNADRLIAELSQCQQTESRGVLLRALHQLKFKTLPGYMRGFLDLVFCYNGRYYILDWKSNRLGSQRKNYAPHLLKIEMEKHFYVLQYYIYAVALHRYLKCRLPGYQFTRHFGGVYYLFLRGIQADSEDYYGIYHDPLTDSVDVIEQLDAALQGEQI